MHGWNEFGRLLHLRTRQRHPEAALRNQSRNRCDDRGYISFWSYLMYYAWVKRVRETAAPRSPAMSVQKLMRRPRTLQLLVLFELLCMGEIDLVDHCT
jgi:hypothetical protein